VAAVVVMVRVEIKLVMLVDPLVERDQRQEVILQQHLNQEPLTQAHQ
tara:strand:+ start:784 stop:924 length:141 start_codon:yes stop_codon:yes gene_type:complete